MQVQGTIKNKDLLDIFDKKAKYIEQLADMVGYVIDADMTYKNICASITAIQMGEVRPNAEMWASLFVCLGAIYERVM